MVKVLENQIVDLDLLPGKEQQELKHRIQEHLAKTGYVLYGSFICFVCCSTYILVLSAPLSPAPLRCSTYNTTLSILSF